MSADEIAKGVAEAKEIDPLGENVKLDENLMIGEPNIHSTNYLREVPFFTFSFADAIEFKHSLKGAGCFG